MVNRVQKLMKMSSAIAQTSGRVIGFRFISQRIDGAMTERNRVTVASDSLMTRRSANWDSPSNRSAVTNGAQLFAQKIDHRSAWPRRFRDLIQLHLSDWGGPECCSEAQVSLVRRAATLEIELERMEYEFARPDRTAGAKALDRYSMLSNTLRRLLTTLGLERSDAR